MELNELKGQSLDVHLPPQIDDDLLSGRSVIYNTLSTVDDFSNDIEFHVPPDPECCFILNQSRLEGCFVVKDESDGIASAADKVVLEGHYGACLFSQIEIYLNGTQVCDQSSSVSYPFKHHIDTMLTYHMFTIKFAPQSEGCFASHDHPCKLEWDDATGIKKTCCSCFRYTQKRMVDGKKVYFSSTIGADVLHMDKYLPPNIDIKIKLKRFNRKFGVLQDVNDRTFSISLQDLKLRMRKVLPSLKVRNRMSARLQSSPGFISYEDTQLKQFHIPKGSTNYSANFINTDIGIMPLQVVFTFIDSSVLSKEKTKLRPFYFDHANLSSVMIKKNGRPLLPSALECNFDENDPDFMYLYDHFRSNVGSKFNIITDAYVKGQFFLFFDLTPDKCHSFHNHVSQPGNLEVDLTFRSATSKSYTLISYCFYNASLRIDNDGQISKRFF